MAALQEAISQGHATAHDQAAQPSPEAADSVESLGQFVGIVVYLTGCREVRGAEAAEQQGQKQVEDLDNVAKCPHRAIVVLVHRTHW